MTALREQICQNALRLVTKYRSLRDVYPYDLKKKVPLEACPACSAARDSFHDFGYLDRYGFEARTSWCERCGLVFINPRLSPQEYHLFYESGAYRRIIEVYSGKPKEPFLEESHIPDRISPVRTLLSHYFKGNEVGALDIGGTTNIYKFLKTFISFKRYVCINPAINEAKNENGHSFEVFKGMIEDFASDEKFDLVCLFGTLNHLLEPRAVFKKIGTLLKDTGVFVFDHVNRISKMAFALHPFQQIQIDHSIYPGTETVLRLLAQADMKAQQRIQVKPSVDFYMATKTNKPNVGAMDPVTLAEIETLSNRTKVLPFRTFFKLLLIKTLSSFS